MEPYYYLHGPKDFFPKDLNTDIFKEKYHEIYRADPTYFSKEVIDWFKEIGITNIKGLIFRKHFIKRPNLHVDPIIAGQEWVDLRPKFVDKTANYKDYIKHFAINWTYQKSGTTEWYDPIEEPDDFGTTHATFAYSSYDKVVGPISTCYHTDNPILYNTGLPHVPVNSVDRITVSIRPGLHNNPNPTFEEVFKHFDKLGLIKQEKI